MPSITELNTPENWEEDDNGFLRTRARILKAGVMAYEGSEIGRGPGLHNVYVPPEEMFNPDALYSLEGMPITVDHEWIDPDNAKRGNIEVGSVAGTPRQNGAYLEADIVIRDKKTIEKIKNRDLVDISAGYLAKSRDVDGTYAGEAYSGQQERIRFNHVALLPAGKGRGGREVRVLNSEGKTPMPTDDFTTVTLGDRRQVRVLNADASVITAEMDAMRVENEKLAGDVETFAKEVGELKASKEKLEGERDELTEKVKKAEGARDEALNPAKIQEIANAMASDQDAAIKILVANGADEDAARKECDGAYGHDLRVQVINCIRTENQQSELTKDQAESEAYVAGVFEMMVENARTSETKQTVVGAQVVQNAMGGGQFGKGGQRMKMNRMKKNRPMSMMNMSDEEYENADPFGYNAHNVGKMKNMGDHDKKDMN